MSSEKTRLVLSLHKGKRIFIGDDITIEFIDKKNSGSTQVKLAIYAPKDVKILREGYTP